MRTAKTARALERAVPIDGIGVERASRRNVGDVDALAASIALEGLRRPVLLMPGGEILKGVRRIAAARLLGWSTIPAITVTTVEAAVDAIIDQRDETSVPRVVTEWVDLGMTIETLDRRERPPKPALLYDTHQLLGPAVCSSGSTYRRARTVVLAARSQERPAHVVDVAQAALADANAGIITVTTAYRRVRVAEHANPVDGLGADGLPLLPPPEGFARSKKAQSLRMDWIRALAGKGVTSTEIADRLGMSHAGLKRIAAAAGVVITADLALNRLQRKAADPNRAVRVAVSDLDALVWSLDKVDAATLDPIEATVWAQQLKEYARSIDRVSRRMAKEHVR